MAGYANVLGSAQLSGGYGSNLMPPQAITEILQAAPKASALLTMANKVQMSAGTARQSVLGSAPDAYWVRSEPKSDSKSGMKETDLQAWEDIVITAEELAVVVPIPDNVVADARIDLWSQVAPRVAEAIGRKLDQAGIFGADMPVSFGTSLLAGAIAAGNVITRNRDIPVSTSGTGANAASTSRKSDLGEDVAEAGKRLRKQGYGISGFASAPGIEWELIGLRNGQGTPIYVPSLAAGTPSTLYGKPMGEVDNGAWDDAQASIIAADWSKVVVGIRQDIEYRIFSEGVITDAAGKVLLNLMQADSKAMRVTFRAGFVVANPLTALQKDKTKRYPAAIVK
ncbi:phage major capsid protein [Nocardia panacis]|uniref:Phage major capsid protein n=1 Tax=Nocardia panacis TaxID=2340916 RepID=A0A3A4KT43_9NOCA|nr:phage major capsid protein [Nocardia panacis]RJO79315.1 phage major capsid protein [Nocardia panacis]